MVVINSWFLVSCRPVKPEDMDWSEHYPNFYQTGQKITDCPHRVEFADIGCGYGGLLGKWTHVYSHPNQIWKRNTAQKLKLSLYKKFKIVSFDTNNLHELCIMKIGKCNLIVLLDTTGKYMGFKYFTRNHSEQYAHRFNDFWYCIFMKCFSNLHFKKIVINIAAQKTGLIYTVNCFQAYNTLR